MNLAPSQRSRFTRARQLSSWRRLSLHVWGPPRDPTVYGTLEINMRKAVAYLDSLNAIPGQPRATVTHLVIKAIAKALAEHPQANALVALRRVYLRSTVDVYCQVATDGGRDLSGVNIREADGKTINQIIGEVAQSVAAVREGRDRGSEQTKRTLGRIPDAFLGMLLKMTGFLTYDLRLDLSDWGIAYDQFGAAMVSNVGGFGLGNGLAPLVPVSRSPIVLLVGEVVDRPAVEEGQLVVAPMVTIGCTFDHRIIDGFQASQMARVVIQSVTDPEAAFGPPIRSN